MQCTYCEYHTDNRKTLCSHISRKHPEHKQNKSKIKKVQANSANTQQKLVFANQLIKFMQVKPDWDNSINLSKWRDLCTSESLGLVPAEQPFELERFTSFYGSNKFYVQLFTAENVDLTIIPWVLNIIPIRTVCFCNLLRCLEATEENLKYILDHRELWHVHHIIEVPEEFYVEDKHRSRKYIVPYFGANAVRLKKITSPAHFLNLVRYLASPFNSNKVKTHFPNGSLEYSEDRLRDDLVDIVKNTPLFDINAYHDTNPVGKKMYKKFCKMRYNKIIK